MSIALRTAGSTNALSAQRAHATQTHSSWFTSKTATAVFVLGFVANMIAALVLTYAWRIGNADALARTANASYIIASRDPHLAAVGFVWPVLPSFAQLPLLPLLRLLGRQELAGPMVSALSGAGVLVLLGAILGTFGITGRTRLVWLALVQCNPQFWYLSASGMAELPSMFFLVLGVYAFLKLADDVLAPALLGTSLALAFFVRYEALSSMAASAAALLVQRWAPEEEGRPMEGRVVVQRQPMGRVLVQWWPLRGNWPAMEGRLFTVLTPPCCAVVLWVLANWVIMGDPLYFNDSTFSLAKAPDVARNFGPHHPLYSAIHSVPITLAYAFRRLAQANLLLPVMVPIALVLGLWRRDRRLIGLVILTCGTFALTVGEVFEGTLPPYLRYWCLATPFAVVLAAACVQQASGWRVVRWLAPLGVIIVLALSIYTTIGGLADPWGSLDERRLAAHLTGNLRLDSQLQVKDFDFVRQHDAPLVAAQLDRLSARGLTLIDTETGFAAILAAHHPERLLISPDRDFRPKLANPRRWIRFIFVTAPNLGGLRDLVSQRYPGIFAGRYPWLRLIGTVHGTTMPWRIYAVVPWSTPLPVSPPHPAAQVPLAARDDNPIRVRSSRGSLLTPVPHELVVHPLSFSAGTLRVRTVKAACPLRSAMSTTVCTAIPPSPSVVQSHQSTPSA